MNPTEISLALEGLLGGDRVLRSQQDLEFYGSDWTKAGTANPSCVVFPHSTDDVVKIVRWAAGQGVPLVPSGGRTGLAGGAMALNGEVVVSFDKMRKIIEMDPYEPALSVQAGCTLAQVQDYARQEGFFFPLDLGAKGSCQIGGNIATNAGGLHFIRYGGAREQVLGLTLVTGTGEILQLGTGLKKDNTGYDLKQLVIGSEGTLGFVTEVILRLQGAKAENLQVALFGVDSFAKVPEILRSCRKSHLDLHAFEFFTDKALKIVQQHKGFPDPLNVKCPYYVLLEVEEKGANLDEWFASLFENQMVLDGVVASSSEEARRMWAYRELITESIAATCHVLKNDVTVRIKDLQAFIAAVEALSQRKDEDAVQIILFGHVGDGNIHLNYVRDKKLSTKEAFAMSAHPLIEAVFGILQSFNGSISAEHGIGILKKDSLVKMREPHHLEMMRKIKRLFDPQGILNPGKIFD